MDTIFELRLEWIVALQQFHDPTIDGFFQGITFMGAEMFCLVTILFLVPFLSPKQSINSDLSST